METTDKAIEIMQFAKSNGNKAPHKWLSKKLDISEPTLRSKITGASVWKRTQEDSIYALYDIIESIRELKSKFEAWN